MRPDNTTSLSILLLDPRRLRCNRFASSIEKTPGVSLIGSTKDLTQAYNLTEHEQPDLVVIAEEVTQLASFPMYAAMLDALEIEKIVVVAGPGSKVHTNRTFVVAEEIERTGGLGPYLLKRAQFTVAALTPDVIPDRVSRPNSPVTPTGWKTVVIGASTGGVEALIEILSQFPATCPPTLIVQHISANFLPGLAQRLDRHCPAQVRPAAAMDDLKPGLVLIAPGNTQHLTIQAQGRRCRLAHGPQMSGHRPSVDMLFHSAVPLGAAAVGVLLTGMGRDGAEGLAAIRRAGGWTIGQDEASSTVYGMPRAAYELNAVAQQLPLERIGAAILNAAASVGRNSGNA